MIQVVDKGHNITDSLIIHLSNTYDGDETRDVRKTQFYLDLNNKERSTMYGFFGVIITVFFFIAFIDRLAECSQCYCGEIRQMLTFLINLYSPKANRRPSHLTRIVQYYRKL
jgi:hypothetical protein